MKQGNMLRHPSMMQKMEQSIQSSCIIRKRKEEEYIFIGLGTANYKRNPAASSSSSSSIPNLIYASCRSSHIQSSIMEFGLIFTGCLIWKRGVMDEIKIGLIFTCTIYDLKEIEDTKYYGHPMAKWAFFIRSKGIKSLMSGLRKLDYI